MKPKKAALCAALAAGLVSLFAATASAHDIYVKGEVGGGFADEYDAPGGDLDSNWRFGVGVGAHIMPHMRLEAEYIHDRADFSNGFGRTHANLGMANAYYDFGPTYGVQPFVGAGIGGGSFDVPGDSDGSFAYQLTAGLAKTFTPRLTGEVAYKFLDAPNLNFGGTDAEYRSSFVTVGLRAQLGS